MHLVRCTLYDIPMQKLAIFDIDGTIFRSSLLIELTDDLIAKGIFPASTAKVYARARDNWLNREGSYDDYIMDVVKAFEGRLKGVPHKTFAKVAEQAVARSSKRVYRYTRDLTQKLKRDGYYLLAISHSPKEMLDPFCEQCGFDKGYGRIHDVGEDGRYTGKTMHQALIDDKAKILKRAVQTEGLTLKGSIGVGDSEADIRFLKLVAKPICFNPNSKLYAHAKRHGWQVVVERKDVIYKM